ncbi:ABC transporter permease [Paenibacillus sanguinis]|uniref:ABC transporter permease n=1 Tax=Paenibacillus sanguinis TaxID=225906 RepID=UPI00036564C5|nr:iron ABC transporter permease [Paenibacillus sanguinis]
MEMLKNNYKLRKLAGILALGIVLGWGVFTWLIYPNLKLLNITLWTDGQFDLKPVLNILASERAIISLRNSFVLACCLTITVNILGLFQILILDYFKIKGSRWLSIAYHSPLICNGMVLVMAYNFLYGSQGLLTNWIPGLEPLWFKGFWPVLIELTFAGTANHILFVRDSLKSVDYQTVEAAQNMGIRSGRILWKVVLPALKPSIFAASILTFIVGISALATPQVLGGDQFETINILIYSFSKTLTTRNYAAILAIFLGLITVIILLVSNYIERKGNYRSVSKVKTPLQKQDIKSPVLRGIVTAIAHVIAVIQTVPLLAVFCFSFMPVTDLYNGVIDFSSFSLNNYYAVFSSTTGIRPVFTSIIYAALASLIVIAVMLILGRIIVKHSNTWTNALELLLQIPWFLPATLIALGLIMAFNKPSLLVLGNVLTGTAFILLLGYIILKIPYTLRMVKAAYTSVDHSLEDAAKNLGASSFKTYVRVVFPIILPAVLSIFLLNFIGLLSEYDMSVFLFHPLYQPLGVVLNAATSSEASPQAQMLSFVYSVLIMLVSTLVILFVYERKRHGSQSSQI